jgi:hypothetical protein
MSTPSLEQRIATALASDDIASVDLATLITETEAAVATADEAATRAREQALDPIASPDANKARAMLETAEFARDRLKTVLPRLQQRCSELRAEETYARWKLDYDAVKAHRDAVAEALKALYLEFVPKLINCMLHAANADVDVARVNNAKPLQANNRDGCWLLNTELTARSLTGIKPDYSIMNIKLPDFGKPEKLAWPPPEVPLGVQMALSVASMDRFDWRNWHEEIDERNRKIIAAANDGAAHYNARQKEREAREKAEGKKAREADREAKRAHGWPV